MAWHYFFVSMTHVCIKSEQLQQMSSFDYLLTEKKSLMFKQTGFIAEQNSVLDLIRQGHTNKKQVLL